MRLLDFLLKKWQERQIQKTIAACNARNAQLREVLRSYRVQLGKTRAVDLHFWAMGEENACALEKALTERGYTVKTAHPCVGGDSAGLWNVEVAADVAPSLTLSEGFTEEMVRLAVSVGAKYDGWGTPITETVADPSAPPTES